MSKTSMQQLVVKVRCLPGYVQAGCTGALKSLRQMHSSEELCPERRVICCRKATKKWDKVVGDRLQPAIMDKVNEQLNPQQNGRALEVGHLSGRTAVYAAAGLACTCTLHNTGQHTS